MMLWKDSIWKTECPFCKTPPKEKKLIIWEWKYWEIRHNKYPYAWLKNHLLVIPKKHKEHTKELSKSEFWELKEVEKFMSNYYWNQNYFSFIRQTNWGKSIKHLHYHFLPWVLYSKYLEEALYEQNIN